MDNEQDKQRSGPIHSALHENVVCVDIDETLILWSCIGEPDVELVDPYHGCLERGRAHKEHVQRIKDHKAAGHFIIAWSGGGGEYCRRAIEALGLTDYVDLKISKPMQYYDDISADEFMGSRSYIGGAYAAKTEMITE